MMKPEHGVVVDLENQPHELEVPLVSATPMEDVPNEEGEDPSSYKDNGRVFLLVAPSDLRKGSRLDIVVPEDGKTSVVRVPTNVKRGDQFHAKECGPLLHRWYDGEFSCGNGEVKFG